MSAAAGRRRLWVALAVVALAVALSACAPGPNPEVGSAAADGAAAGFWLGLWHGVIAPITFLISLVNSDVNVYEVRNSGNWYNFGFIIGIWVLPGGGASGSRRTR